MKIKGKNINLRTAKIEDATFILQLRLFEHKIKYLSQVDNNLKKQQTWLKEYKEKEDRGLEYYFIFKKGTFQNTKLQNSKFI